MKRLILCISVVLILLFTGCVRATLPFYYVDSSNVGMTVPLETHVLRIDSDFDSSDVASIVAAVGEWNYVMNGVIHIDVVYGLDLLQAGEGDWVVMKIGSDNSRIHDRSPGRVLAFVNRVGGKYMWVIRDRMNARMVHGIVLHELGHLLGAEHDGQYLMSPRYDAVDYACIDYEAANEVAEYHAVSVNQFRYCQHSDPPYPLPKF